MSNFFARGGHLLLLFPLVACRGEEAAKPNVPSLEAELDQERRESIEAQSFEGVVQRGTEGSDVNTYDVEAGEQVLLLDGQSIVVTLAGGERFPATIRRRRSFSRVAVISVQRVDLPRRLRTGETVQVKLLGSIPGLEEPTERRPGASDVAPIK